MLPEPSLTHTGVLAIVALMGVLSTDAARAQAPATPATGPPAAAPEASAEAAPPEDAALLHHAPMHLARDLWGLSRSRESLAVLGGGLAVVAALHPADTRIRPGPSDSRHVDLLRVGNFFGSAEGIYGFGFALYGLGWATRSARAERAGLMTLESLVVAQGIAAGLKQAVRRQRPDGGDRLSFPSGHTTNAFTVASVLDVVYGHKYGLPAYLIASTVAYSRVASHKHYASDVVFGAAVGTAVGRAVTRLHTRRVMVAPALGRARSGVDVVVVF